MPPDKHHQLLWLQTDFVVVNDGTFPSTGSSSFYIVTNNPVFITGDYSFKQIDGFVAFEQRIVNRNAVHYSFREATKHVSSMFHVV